MTDLYHLALLASNIALGGAVLWLLIRPRPVKKEKKKKQRARAGRDIGTQAGRDVTQHQHYYGLPEHMGPREQSLTDTITKLLGQLQEKDQQLRAGMDLKIRLMNKIEQLDEANTGLIEEVGRLKEEQLYLPLLERKTA